MPAIGLKTGFSDRVSIKLEVNDDVIWLWPGVRLSFAGRGLPITVGVLLARGVRLPGALEARGWSCPLTVGLSFGQMLRLPRRNPMSTLRRSLIVRPRSGAGSGRALLRWSAPTTRPSVRVPASYESYDDPARPVRRATPRSRQQVPPEVETRPTSVRPKVEAPGISSVVRHVL